MWRQPGARGRFGGVLEHAIAALSPVRAVLAPLLLDILDPCIELDVKGMHDA